MSQNIFKPFRFLNFVVSNDVALVLLNQKWSSLSSKRQNFLKFFDQLWKKSCFSASVDGGTNTLHDLNKQESFRFIPDVISGDFDSVNQDLLDFYKAKKTEIIHTPDQDYTDFTKCLKIIHNKYQENSALQSMEQVLCLIGESDRVDHVMSNLNTLLTSREYFPTHINVCLLSQESCTFFLSEGRTLVDLEAYDFPKPQWCYLLPVQCPALVSTTGLQTNFNAHRLKMGTFSNFRYNFNHTEKFSVDTDKPLFLILPMELF